MRWSVLAALLAARAGAAPTLEVQPGTPRPGDAVLITVAGAGMPVKGMLGTHVLKFYKSGDDARALVALPVSEGLGPIDLWVELKPQPNAGHPKDAGTPADGGAEEWDAGEEPQQQDEEEEAPPDAGAGAVDSGRPDAGRKIYVPKEPALTAALEVVDPHFPARELNLPKKFTNPPKSVAGRIVEDQAAITAAYKNAFRPPLFTQNFAWPRESEITSHFGDLRLINGVKHNQHLGTDLEGRTGDPIYASNDGTVTLARPCYYSGNTVLVHHGIGLYTAYFHMTRIDVKAGQRVKRGQRLGVVGKTGQVTGPHLHFAAKLNGNYVNPEGLLRLDFDGSGAGAEP